MRPSLLLLTAALFLVVDLGSTEGPICDSPKSCEAVLKKTKNPFVKLFIKSLIKNNAQIAKLKEEVEASEAANKQMENDLFKMLETMKKKNSDLEKFLTKMEAFAASL